MFQIAVIDEYLEKLNEDDVKKSYEAYTQNFLDIERVQNITDGKEEQYQYGFLKDLFVDCLGYTISPNANYNLQTEYHIKHIGKADGVIIDGDSNTLAVIELKSTKTKDMNSITKQLFGYKGGLKDCRFAIASNFAKLRFYIDVSEEFIEFDLFELDYEKFKLLYLLLSKESIFEKLPLQLKDKSKSKDEDISNQLYRDYRILRSKLFENIVNNNADRIDELTLLQLTQKLLDRFIFIFFAEDRGILPSNTIRDILNRYDNDVEYRNLYHHIKIYFEAINKGNDRLNIFGYNGGLFATDEQIDSLIIDAEVIKENLILLSDYNFKTEVDVDILGHIFENSLNDLEELRAEIKGKDFDKTQTKRKKDGVFYTPKYVTKYIVDSTLGQLCMDKKTEMGIYNIEIPIPKTKKLNKKERELLSTIESYRDYLLSLKLLDLSCGSGAFLNQLVEFLKEEHQWVDEAIKTLMGGNVLALFDIEKEVLEHNIYGVDINEEAVEIAKLSLWIHTVERGRKLNKLSERIVVGNSLISDTSIDSKAFDWAKRFKSVIDDGGFDVIVGNPPYFNIQTLGANSPIANHIKDTSEIWMDKSDILFYFIEKAIKLAKHKVGFIVSNAFLKSAKAVKLRNYILDNAPISKIIDFEKYMVFDDASITSTIFELDKHKTDTIAKALVFKEKNYTKEYVSETIYNDDNYFDVALKKDSVYALVDVNIAVLNDKIDGKYPKLGTLVKVGKGMETAANKVFGFKEFPTQFPKEFIKKRMSGEIIKKYEILKEKEYILYTENAESFKDLPQSVQNHLNENSEFLKNRATVKNEGRIWWRYSRPMHKENYHLNKLWCSYRAKENIFCFDDTEEYIGYTNTTVIFDTNDEIDLLYLLALLNSKLLTFRYRSIGKQTGSGVFEYFENGISKLPIPHISKDKQQPFIKKAQSMIEMKKKLNDYNGLMEKFKKDSDFDNLVKIEKEIEALNQNIVDTDNEINRMVYELYEMSDSDIEIIEKTLDEALNGR